MNEKRIHRAMEKHAGDFYAVAEEIGEEPFRVRNFWIRYADKHADDAGIARLAGAMDAYHDLGNRLRSARNFQKENNRLRRDNRALNDLKNLDDALKKALARKHNKPSVAPSPKPGKGRVHEWLFSDLHYGKICDGYDVATAEARVMQYAEEVRRWQEVDAPQYTRVAFLGDLIENANKHRDSRSGCEVDTAQQIVGAYRLLKAWLEKIITPGAGYFQIVACTGNHENLLGRGSQLNFMGKAHASFIIYSLLADEFDASHIEWHIPDGSFAVVGDTLYEHGDYASPTEQSMAKVLVKRSRQVGKVLRKYRQGDKHVAVVGDAGNLVCNGSFFTDKEGTEYSGVHGYTSEPCQIGFESATNTARFVRF